MWRQVVPLGARIDDAAMSRSTTYGGPCRLRYDPPRKSVPTRSAMNATPDNTLADPEQLIADLRRQFAEREAERSERRAERDEVAA